ncbi:MAG: alpha/beta fold hydrolase [Bacteroidales bacterium]|nr:alpha/beta fold hydrolase [Bacteroidales bacterium]MBN2821394.1 alpha/beta fold hydrolase [Bacteroidales bacterium]
MKKLCLIAITLLTICSCEKEKTEIEVPIKSQFVNLTSHKLASYYTKTNSKYLIVFESGLGDDHAVWQQQPGEIAKNTARKMDVLMYDRGGYGSSTLGNTERNIECLSSELDKVINTYSNNRKVILVGHELGGMVVRDYAIKHSEKTAAILFVDALHEQYNNFTESDEQTIYSISALFNGRASGAALEALQLREDDEYMSSLPNLPDVPVIALTSIKIEGDKDKQDRELWFHSKESLKEGVSDFEHITTAQSEHIMKEEPNLVLDALDNLISKLP